MTDNLTRRGILKSAAATGAATAGVTAVSGQAAAQQGQWINVGTVGSGTLKNTGDPQVKRLENVQLKIQDIDTSGKPPYRFTGRLRGQYVTNPTQQFNELVSGLLTSITQDGTTQGPGNQEQVLVSIDLEDVTIDVLGLIIDIISVQVEIRCDPAGGLLGELLCGLLGPN